MLLRRRRSPKTSRTCPTLLATGESDDRVEVAVFEVTDGELETVYENEAGDYQRMQAPLGLGELKDGELLVDADDRTRLPQELADPRRRPRTRSSATRGAPPNEIQYELG